MTQPFSFWRPGPDLDESHKQCKSHLVLGATPDVLILTQSGDKGGLVLSKRKRVKEFHETCL